MAPDWTTLRIFLAALELGSLTGAAARCGIAVSAAARRIQDLEAAHGVQLLARSARGVRPTAAGEVLAAHARALVAMEQRLGDDLRAMAAGETGRVRLDATASVIVGHPLPERLAAFRARYPGIAVELAEVTSATALRDVGEGRADLGFITTAKLVPPEIEVRPWREDRLLAVAPAAWRARLPERLSFAALIDEPLVGLVAGGALAVLLEEAAERLGRALRYRFVTASPDAAVRLVAAGHGITVMPDGVMRVYGAHLGLVGIPLDEPWAQRTIRLVSRPGPEMPAAARRLLGVLTGRDDEVA